jgi:hypothetical protein
MVHSGYGDGHILIELLYLRLIRLVLLTVKGTWW